MKVLHVVGARPNFMKVAPVMAEMARHPELFEQKLVHTGQHYDDNMSKIFFDELELPLPDEFLHVGPGSHAEQTARVMTAFEPVLRQYAPDWVVVVGDVNSTLACALVAAKGGVRTAHVEAGLRSGDRTMPEEINRIVTDQLADLLLTPSADGDANLLREGIAPEKIRFVGNVMIDTLVRMIPRASEREILKRLGLAAGDYLLVTLHRPSNVDRRESLEEICRALGDLSRKLKVVFPMHPRTCRRVDDFALSTLLRDVLVVEPQGYLDMLALLKSARVVLTDSGGIQEETTFLGIPCLTLRTNTERPVTLTSGTNRLISGTHRGIMESVETALEAPPGPAPRPELWDGRAAERIVNELRCFH